MIHFAIICACFSEVFYQEETLGKLLKRSLDIGDCKTTATTPISSECPVHKNLSFGNIQPEIATFDFIYLEPFQFDNQTRCL